MAEVPSNTPEEVVIYHYPTSYWSQMVRLAAVEKGIPFRKVQINHIKGENYTPDYVRINPACEVPAVTHRGMIFAGTQDIIEYFDKISTQEKPEASKQAAIEDFRKKCFLIPIDAISMAVSVIPKLWDGIQVPDKIRENYAKRINRVEVLEANIIKYPELADAYHEKLARVRETESRAFDVNIVYGMLTDLETYLDDVDAQLRALADGGDGSYKGWLFGKDFTNADIAMATLLARLDLLGFAGRLWDLSERLYLADYYRRLKQRPSFKQVIVLKTIVTPNIPDAINSKRTTVNQLSTFRDSLYEQQRPALTAWQVKNYTFS